MPPSSSRHDGLTLSLSSSTTALDSSDWRMAMFSIALPVPPAGLPESSRNERIIELGSGWEKGRFAGITAINVRSDQEKPQTYRSHPSPAAKRYSSPLKESVGAGKTSPHVFHHKDCGTQYRVRIDDGAAVSLADIEFLQYLGMRSHNNDGKEIELGLDYLVLHVLVENCSSDTLDTLSGALHRPNQKQNRLSYSETSGDRVRQYNGANLYSKLVSAAVNELNDGRYPADEGFDMELTKGSYLVGPSHGAAAYAGAIVEGGSGFARIVGSRSVRTVCAVPVGDSTCLPRQYDGFLDADELSARDNPWSSADMWASSLSSCGDQYAEGIPDLSLTAHTDSIIGDHRYWSMASSPTGLAVVRTSAATGLDPKPWNLTSTRYLDLLLLVHRSREYLIHLGKRLREFHFDLPDGVDSIDDASVAEENLHYLEKKSERFGDIQSDLVFFRDHLWFDTIPDQEVDTRILRAFRNVAGIAGRYGDISSEIALRKDVYTTLHQTVSLQIDRKLSKLKQQEANDRADRDSRQNLWLGSLGLAFAVPSVLQMSPLVDSWHGFIITLVLVAVFITGFWAFLRMHN